MPDPVWVQKLKELLCKMYQEWGGDCANLPLSCHDQIGVLTTLYGRQGAPPIPSTSAIKAFVILLDQVNQLLTDPACTLEDEDRQTLSTLIAELRTDFSNS